MPPSDSDKRLIFTKWRVTILSIFTVAVVAVVLFAVFFRKPPQYYVRYGIALGTNIKIAYATDKGNAKTVVDEMYKELDKINMIFNPYVHGSELYNLNHTEATWTKVSPRLLNVLNYSMDFAKATKGDFDPSLGREIVLWGFNTDNPKQWTLPSKAQISEALRHSGYENIHIKGNEVKLDNGIWIDLGAIAKGYAAEVLVKMAKANDPHSTGYVSIGGDIGIIGPMYGNKPWKIGVRDPRGTINDAIAYVYLYKGFIATSGDYERYIIVNGKRYYHIFDPKTGYSNDYYEGVTSISSGGMLSDAFGTAIMVSGPSMLDELANKYGVAYLTVNEKGQIQTNSLWKEHEKP